MCLLCDRTQVLFGIRRKWSIHLLCIKASKTCEGTYIMMCDFYEVIIQLIATYNIR